MVYKLMCRFVFFFLCLYFHAQADHKETWGINAVMIGRADNKVPIIKGLSESGNQVLSLNQFYRIGGENIPATPTKCRLVYTEDSLFVLFRCTETNMTYPTRQHNVNWYKSSPVKQDAAFPDKVDLFLRPGFNELSYYQFSVTKDGKHFGNKHHFLSEGKSNFRKERITDFRSTVIRKKGEWTVLLHIPWQAIGGKPDSYFGFIPMRTHWRNGEVSSPVALDFTDRPSSDLYIEAHLAAYPKIFRSSSILTQLPSGTRRWIRPVLLKYPSEETIRAIYKLEQSINRPTTSKNLPHRIKLIQAWTDLMELEGFNFGSTRGSIVLEDMYPAELRIQVNKALRKRNVKQACTLLDTYLKRLNSVSLKWFADGSPADIREQAWKSIREIKDIEVNSHKVIIHCLAEGHLVDLHLSFPESGGVRLWANKEGFFKPDGLLPIKVKKTVNTYHLMAGKQNVIVKSNPFTLIFCDSLNKSVLDIQSGDIAFLFGKNDSVKAVDFKNNLYENESIYGFGERYDHFNQRGHILTLWGMDDWIGNTIGLQNETYKPIPLFHSSKGYTIFINSSYRLRADVGLNVPNRYRLTQHGPVFDYFIWTQPPLSSIQSYTDITGKPILPPKWAFEPWMGRTGTAWANNKFHDAVYEEKKVTQRFAHLDIPHSAIYAERGADSPELYTFMAPRDIHVLSWFYSEIPKKKQETLLPEIQPDQLPILKFEDTIQSSSHDISYVDFTNPHAFELSKRWWKHRLDLGVSGSMVDFGDRVPEDAIFYNGKRGDEMHNFYAYLYHKTYSKVFREKRGNNYILFARSAAPGDQKWICQFSGDHASNFKGLQGELTGGLNLCACGFSTWGTQLGGHRGWPDPVVYMRWTQLACFSPLMRAHGMAPREPWEYGQAAIKNYKHYTWVRENLLDYIYNEAIYAHKTGIPIMKSMAISYPRKTQYGQIDDQYLFGRDLLVAPIVCEDTFRTVFFPPGKWTNLWNGKIIRGGDSAIINAPLNTIPVYLKEGAILPVDLDSILQFGESMTDNRVSALIITPPANYVEKQLQNAQDTMAKVRLQSEQIGFSVEMNDLPEILYLIIYDTRISEVKINGEELPLLKGKELVTLPPGWYTDIAHNRIIIRLPYNVHRSVEVKYRIN